LQAVLKLGQKILPLLAANSSNTLGEGPVWDASAARLYWVDIQQSLIFEFDPVTSAHRTWQVPYRPSLAAPAYSGGLTVVSEGGIFQFSPATGLSTKPSGMPECPEGFRSNDAKVDPSGTLWWSTMDDDGGKRPGDVYRYACGVSTLCIKGVHIANSIAFSADGKWLYLSDSALKTLWRFPRLGDANVGPREVFAVFDSGEPDGAAIDVEGALWVAVWGGARLDRFMPDGTLDRSIPLPVSQPTSCAFGGTGLDVLYITSARAGLSAEALAREPLAGAIFSFSPGVCGQPIPPLKCGTFDAPPGLTPERKPLLDRPQIPQLPLARKD
jgi:sugar lactone lactonase YvrE